MSIEVSLPTILQNLVGGTSSVSAEGETLEELFDSLEGRYPGFKARVINEKREIRHSVKLNLDD